MKRFPSIKKNREYREIYNTVKGKACGVLVVFVKDNGLGYNRLGISVSRKVGNSVVRHTFSRRIREIFRLNNYQTAQGKDIIVTARSRAGSADYARLNREYLKLLECHGIRLEMAPKSEQEGRAIQDDKKASDFVNKGIQEDYKPV